MAQNKFYGTTSDKWISRIIRTATLGSHVSHVGCVFKDAWSSNPILASAHWRDGFHLRKVADELPSLHWTWATLTVSIDDAHKHHDWIDQQLGKKYDFSGLSHMLGDAIQGWNRERGWPGVWFCAAVMLQSLIEIGKLRPTDKPDPLRAITPDTFMWILYTLGATFEQWTPPQ